MMADGKETLTYTRQKPPIWIAYKRKRLLPRKDSCQQDECLGIDNTPMIEEKKKESIEGNKSECPKKDPEPAPEKAENKSSSIKQQGHVAATEQSSKEDTKNETLHDMELPAESLAVLDGSLETKISQQPSEGQICPIPTELLESNSVLQISCSFLNPSSSDEKSTVTCSVPLPASSNTVVEPDNSSLKTGYTSECTVEKPCLKERKRSSPLITFQRRYKRKKDIDGLHAQNTLDVNCDGTPESTGFASVKEGTHSERGSEHALIASKNVESSYAGDRSSSESGSFTQPDHKMENIMREDTSTIEVLPQITELNVCSLDKNVSLHSPEGPAGNSSNDATVDPALEPALFNNDSSEGKSQDLSSGLNAEKGIEIPCAGGSTKAIDLSISAQDCGVASLCEENSHGNSLDAPSGSHTTPLDVQSPGVKGLDLLHENIGESYLPHRLVGNGCTSAKAVSCKNNVFANSSSADTLRNSYLQLFPEHSDRSCSTKAHQKGSANSVSEERTVNPLGNSSQAGTPEANSSRFRSLFLPMERINNRQNSSFPSSHWPNGGSIQSREFFKDTVPPGFQVNPSTSMRQKMMLDNIVNKARTSKRSSGLQLYGYPTAWSDEELDRLWIGVRRYGKGNWEVMLKDPRLGFPPWRNAWDLAQQWEQEQTKLLRTMAPSQGINFRIPSGVQDRMDGLRHPMVRNQNSVEDVQLSLGNMIPKPKDGGRKRSQPNFVDIQNNATMQHQLTGTSSSSRSTTRRAATFPHSQTQDVGSSAGRANYSAYMPSGKDFPHWLKELVSHPLRPPQAAVLTDTSGAGPVEVHHADKGIDHEQRSLISSKRTTLRGRELRIGAEAQNNMFPAVKDDENKQEDQHPANKRDLIVIDDSDASSEETISDHRGATVG
ncbi:OLC1v1025828C3 [Oldenlandia corymbosa var. corymbosa]|uniref:OLC1v1025828C3 n=1 Tax=Oldenlandia corymbosa var. corymbosa TaxID=529605 RepID=A0AAV1C722_OLDCO|nr:OLC1v1025828C3 [Oldenlandia corymbosa var. corymbosa]